MPAAVGRLERDLSVRVDLPLAWYDVLLQRAEAPGRRLRMAELADRVLLSRSGLTRPADQLAADGLVSREPEAAPENPHAADLDRSGIDTLLAPVAKITAS